MSDEANRAFEALPPEELKKLRAMTEGRIGDRATRRDFLRMGAAGMVAMATPDPLGILLPTEGRQVSWLEFDDDGIPYRMSTQPDSPYYYPNGHAMFRVMLNGRLPGCCIGYNRKDRYVECRPILGKRWWYDARQRPRWPVLDPERAAQVIRRYGKVEVSRA